MRIEICPDGNVILSGACGAVDVEVKEDGSRVVDVDHENEWDEDDVINLTAEAWEAHEAERFIAENGGAF